jgi:uncharacterized membrane protein YhhN
MVQTGSWARWVLIAAALVGGSYLLGMDLDLSDGAMLAWKGGGVWLLAVYAALQARTTDGWLITGVMALGAAGDVLVEMDETRGAAAFAIGHMIAIALYVRNRRPTLTPSQMGLAMVVVPATILIAWLLPSERSGVTGVIFYAFLLSLMTASAWISRFPRYRTGIGAMLFLASDLLIFARMGPLSEAIWVDYAIWGLYFVGQVLIVVGVTQTLNAASEDRLQPLAR